MSPAVTVTAKAVTLTHHSLADPSDFQAPSSIHGVCPTQHTIFYLFFLCLSSILYFYCAFSIFSYTNAQHRPTATHSVHCGRCCAGRSPGAAAARAAQVHGGRCRLGVSRSTVCTTAKSPSDTFLRTQAAIKQHVTVMQFPQKISVVFCKNLSK